MTHNEAVAYFKGRFSWENKYQEELLTAKERTDKEAMNALEEKNPVSIHDAMKIIKQHAQNTDCGACEMRKNCSIETGCPCFWEV